MKLYPHTVKDGHYHRLCCNTCGKAVSTPFHPLLTDTPDGGLVVRAFIQCPECMDRAVQEVRAREGHA